MSWAGGYGIPMKPMYASRSLYAYDLRVSIIYGIVVCVTCWFYFVTPFVHSYRSIQRL